MGPEYAVVTKSSLPYAPEGSNTQSPGLGMVMNGLTTPLGSIRSTREPLNMDT